MFHKVLVGTDMVTVRDAPVVTATRIAKQYNAKLHVIHVLESDSTDNRYLIRHFKTGENFVTGIEYENTVKEKIKKIYAEVLNSYDNYEIRVTPGLPWEEILRWSREVNADLIVIGPHSTRAEDKGVVRVAGNIKMC